MTYVYKHTFPDNLLYFGIADDPDSRWNDGKGYDENPDLFEAVKKYGWDNIKHEVLAQFEDRKQAEELEQRLILYYHTEDPKYGYNRTRWGSSLEKIVANGIEKKKKPRPAKDNDKFTVEAVLNDFCDIKRDNHFVDYLEALNKVANFDGEVYQINKPEFFYGLFNGEYLICSQREIALLKGGWFGKDHIYYFNFEIPTCKGFKVDTENVLGYQVAISQTAFDLGMAILSLKDGRHAVSAEIKEFAKQRLRSFDLCEKLLKGGDING